MSHVDRISTLPDDIICDRILSLLPTKDSVRTSVLSTRWCHLFAFVPVIDFVCRDFATLSIVTDVLNTIRKNGSCCLSKLRIHLEDMNLSHQGLVPWIDYFTSHSIQQLDLAGFLNYDATPHSLFTCETLVSLSLDIIFELSIPDKVCLPKLKELCLKNIRLMNGSDDESISKLFSSCPMLEKLMVKFDNMPDARAFNVSVSSLKVLSLYLYDTKVELVINCPNLNELTCECYATRGYTGDVLRVLKKCDIKVQLSEDKFEGGKLIELVRQVCKVQFLALDGDSMQALLVPPHSFPSFENLTHLKLDSHALDGWLLLPIILDSSPRLETLVFGNGFYDEHDSFGNPFLPPEHVPVCLSFHLRVIRIGRFCGEEDGYKWVEYFLTNALVLEMIEICLCSSVEDGGEGERDSSESSEEEYDSSVEQEEEEEEEEEVQRQFISRLEQYFEMSKRLLTFQRSSRLCQIIFVSSD